MALMHAEDPAKGERCVAETEALYAYANDHGLDSRLKTAEILKKFAVEHLEPVKKFGRYPTRNKALGRATTAEEEEYLKKAGGWGQ